MVTAIPSDATWSLTADCVARTDPNPGVEPDDVLEPFRIRVYEADSWRIRKGWPVEVPPYDVRGAALVSAEGEILRYRPDPSAILPSADARWIAGDTYNTTSLVWETTQATYSEARWLTSADHAPSLEEDYTYRVGRELITRTGLAFTQTSSDHLWSEFPAGLRNTTAYTLIMVVALRSSYNVPTADNVEFSGLIAPGAPAPAPGEPSLHMRNGGLWVQNSPENPFVKGLDAQSYQTETAPGYLVWAVGAPEIRVYLGRGPRSMRSFRTVATEPISHNLNLLLGAPSNDTLHTANMLLFDVCLYTEQLNDTQVGAEIAILSGSYGGS